MTTVEIVIKRTGMSAEDAEFYVVMAAQRVCDYLHLGDTADLTRYTFPIADIAVLYWQKDESNAAIASSLGFSETKFQEGSVSESHSVMTGAKINETYETAITDVLAGLDGGGDGLVVFL